MNADQAAWQKLDGECRAIQKRYEIELARAAAARGSASAGISAAATPGFICPFPGSSFINSWGAARSGGRKRMRQLVRGGSQFVIATHSPILMAYPGARLLLLDAGGMREVRYEETEHYAVTKVFLQDPARMLRELFGAMDAQEDAAQED